jgi:sugar lactone lactonase YvrE
MDGGFIIGNGIAFSPDDTRLYFADSRDETVWVYDFDVETGAIANRRTFFSTDDLVGRVDGATCDVNGNYWCALVHGGAVACISPAGRLVERIAVPAPKPTMVTFGGPDLATLFVTSATNNLTCDEWRLWPDSGKVFAITGLGTRGLPEPLFGEPH